MITAPELFGRLHVMPVVDSFLEAYPRAQVRVLLLNRMVDLVGEGVDVAVRLADLPDSSMNAVKIGEVRRLICAAPSYLDGRAPLAHPSELQNHWCIGLNETGAQELWRYRENTPARCTRSVRVTCRLSLNSAPAAIKAAEHGMGLVRPLSYQIERQVADGSLVVLLREYELEPVPVHMVFQSGKSVGSVVRAFIDHAVSLLRRGSYRDI